MSITNNIYALKLIPKVSEYAGPAQTSCLLIFPVLLIVGMILSVLGVEV